MLDNYLFLKNVFLKKESSHLLTRIDTIIFDIDGVLVNVDSSYYQTIKDTVKFYFENILKMPLPAELAEKEVILKFKMIGGFNDDWELCAALILFYLWKMKEYRIPLTVDLLSKPPLISNFIREHLADGGGLPTMVHWLKDRATHPEEIFSIWNQEQIFQIAKEFYAGEQYCYDFYHFHPDYIKKAEGNIARETTLFESELVNFIKKYHIGIFTGRSGPETAYVLKKIGWLNWLLPESIITFDHNIKKPSSSGIEILSDRFQSETGLYIGDTMDDFLTVQNINKKFQVTKYLSAIITGQNLREKREKERVFLPKGVDLLGENVNEVVRLLADIYYGREYITQ